MRLGVGRNHPKTRFFGIVSLWRHLTSVIHEVIEERDLCEPQELGGFMGVVGILSRLRLLN